MTYIPYLGTFFSHGTPVWPWPVILLKILWVTTQTQLFLTTPKKIRSRGVA